MQLVTFGGGRVGCLEGGRVIEIAGTTTGCRSAMRGLIEVVSETGVLPEPTGSEWRLEEVVLEAPVPDPSKIIAAPINYVDHQAEMNVDSQVGSLGFFLKAPSSVLRPDGVVQLPYHDRRFDQEGELAAVIGRRARRVSEADALHHVFGYTGLLDITMRGREDRSMRKSFETFTPLGPMIVTSDEFGAPDDVRLRCWVNGELRQDATTADLIWGVARLVSYASWVTTLEPADVVTTGTPAGVAPIRAGDSIELELAGLPRRLSVTVAEDAAVASHTSGG